MAASMTAGQAISELQRQSDQLEMVFYLYVVNEHGHLVAEPSSRDPREQEHRSQRRQGRGHPRAQLAGAVKKPEAGRLRPVQQRRLYRPGHALEGGHHEIAAPGHLDGGPGEARLVRVDEGRRPQAKEQEHRSRGRHQPEDQPAAVFHTALI